MLSQLARLICGGAYARLPDDIPTGRATREVATFLLAPVARAGGRHPAAAGRGPGRAASGGRATDRGPVPAAAAVRHRVGSFPPRGVGPGRRDRVIDGPCRGGVPPRAARLVGSGSGDSPRPQVTRLGGGAVARCSTTSPHAGAGGTASTARRPTADGPTARSGSRPTICARFSALARSAVGARPHLLRRRPRDRRRQRRLWDTVGPIESWGDQEVYDATVLGTHNFIADGIAVHNSIEQDADMVVLLHREDSTSGTPRAGEADFIVAKHRNGPTATITVTFQGHYSRFVDMAHS